MDGIAEEESIHGSEGTQSLKASSLMTAQEVKCSPNAEEEKNGDSVRKVASAENLGPATSETMLRVVDQSSDRVTRGSRLFKTSSTKLNSEESRIESLSSEIGPTNCIIDMFEMKKLALKNYIHENPRLADFKWSLFCAACHSYRYDSVLRPFPSMFLKNDMKDIDNLREVVESCPSFSVIFEQIHGRHAQLLSTELINLLYWVLVHNSEPQLVFIPKEMHDVILKLSAYNSTAAAPHYILQVQYNRQPDEETFNNLAQNYGIINAFHGSRLDNFYSILNYGIKISFNKMSVYGPGIQLSSGMDVDLQKSQSGFSWGGSFFGSQISVIALCELIDHPDVKRMSPRDAESKDDFVADARSIFETIFVVPNYEWIRLKYLLVYCNNSPKSSLELPTPVVWFQRNKFMAVMLTYVLLLLAIALSNSSTLYKYYRRIVRNMKLKVVKL